MAYQNGPRIVTDGLILALDASNTNSYISGSLIWYDLSGQNAHAGLSGSISYVNSTGSIPGYFNFTTANDSNYFYSSVSQNYLDITAIFQPDFSRVGNANIAGLISSGPNSGNTDKSLRFGTVNGTGPWTISNPGDGNDWAVAGSPTTYYVNGNVSNTLVSGWNILGGYRTNQAGFPLSFKYHLGSSGYTSRAFQGRLTALYMYNRALSQSEHLQNYRSLKSRFNL